MGTDYLPDEYETNEHGALGICVTGVLTMIEPSEPPTDPFSARCVIDRIFNGIGQGGEAATAWELARWKHRGTTEAGQLAGDFGDDDFLIWTAEDSYYVPRWRVYSEAEFKEVFVAACRNFVRRYPARRNEFEDALSHVGLTL